MNDKAIEEEIQARIDFKMGELLTAIKKCASANWKKATKSGVGKYAYYWEAYKQMEEMFYEELHKPPPDEDMAIKEKQKSKQETIVKIINEINQFGYLNSNDERRIRKFLWYEIGKLQN